MILHIRDWYFSRSVRERRLILLMLSIALPVLAWLLVVRPVSAAYEKAVDEHVEAVDRHGRVLALAEAAKSAPSRRIAANRADLQLVVTESAAAAGIALQAAYPGGPDAIDVSVAAARTPALMQWLAHLEAKGLSIRQLSMTPLPDGTVTLSARLARAG